MKLLNSLIWAVAAVAITASVALPAAAADFKAKTVVLVHGAVADGSSWNKVIASEEGRIESRGGPEPARHPGK